MTDRLEYKACHGMICIETSSQSELVEHAMRWGLDRRGRFTHATYPLKPNKSENRCFSFRYPLLYLAHFGQWYNGQRKRLSRS
jgi:hypothetical protein